MTRTMFQPGIYPRIFLEESRFCQGKPLAQALLKLAWSQGIAGATAFKGVEGFGLEHHLSTERLPDVAINLPVVATMADEETALARRQPFWDEMVPRGMITTSSVTISTQGGQA